MANSLYPPSSSPARKPKRWLHVWASVVLMSSLWLLPGCAEKEFSAQIVPYNHTDQYIDAVYVNGKWGGNSFAHSGGGKFACCVTLPVRPPEGYTVKVGWDDDDGKHHERDVVVPPFEKTGDLSVHFLRGDQIKVFVTDKAMWHPDYPLTGEEAYLREGVPNPQPNLGK
jgi:hypothetical protein